MSDPPYKVGYGKPPAATRFGKGHSGNPAGSSAKRRAARAPKADGGGAVAERFGAELARLVQVSEQGGTSAITRLDALVRQAVAIGMRGNRLAVQQALERAERDAQADREDRQACYQHWSDYVATHQHVPRVQPYMPQTVHYPHPADIQLRADTLAVTFVGPLDATEAKVFLLPRMIRDHCLAVAVVAGRARARAGAGPGDPDPALLRIALSVHRLIPPSLEGRSLNMAASSDAMQVAAELLTRVVKSDHALHRIGFVTERAIEQLISDVTAKANDIRCATDATINHLWSILAALGMPEPAAD